MNAQSKIEAPTLAKLREPFADNHISKKPQQTKRQTEEARNGKNVVYGCATCGGNHHRDAIHLDYVGHAALTDRLLDVDPEWDWEPMAYAPDGLPLFDRNGGLWIKLTVLGKTRIGYGDADGKQGGNAIKEAIGDALRNSGMRFGMALDLWHKGQLHVDEDSQGTPEAKPEPKPEAKPRGRGGQGQRTARKDADAKGGMPEHAFAKITQLIQATNTAIDPILEHYGVFNIRELSEADYDDAVDRLEKDLARLAKADSNGRGGSGEIDPNDHSFS